MFTMVSGAPGFGSCSFIAVSQLVLICQFRTPLFGEFQALVSPFCCLFVCFYILSIKESATKINKVQLNPPPLDKEVRALEYIICYFPAIYSETTHQENT